MPSLADIQDEFARALRDPGLPPPLAVTRNLAAKTSRRFDVYRNNMVAGLVDALKSTFPAIQRLVGDEYFQAAARAYIDQYPPRSPVLLLYGESFGEFLDQLPSASGVPYLGDVARLEWARINALHAPDAEPAGIETLARIPRAKLESVRFATHPSLSVIASRWPIVSLWSASVGAGNAKVNMKAVEHAVVVRPALRIGVHGRNPGGGTFLKALSQGARLGDAARRSAEAGANFDLAAQLQFVFETGAITALNIREENQT
jgi:hypothetical protein